MIMAPLPSDQFSGEANDAAKWLCRLGFVPSLAESSPRRTPARTAKAVARRKGPKVAAAASKKSAAAAKARKK